MSRPAAADPISAVGYFLLDAVGELAEGRVFSPVLRRTEDEFMPRACVVVSAAGGYSLFGDGYLPVGDPRVDVRCYGSTELEGQNLARACLIALKQLRPSVWGGVRLQWASVSSGLMALIDENTLWPFSLVSYQVMADEYLTA